MVVLATMEEKRFLPSLLEAPGTALPQVGGTKTHTGHSTPAANYTIDTVRRLRQTLKKADRLFFLIGIDAFTDIAKWHEAEALLRECEFIVASRPGYSLADIANALPASLRPKAEVTRPFSKQPAKGDLVLPGVTIHLLENVQQNISATTIREAVAAKRALTKFLDPAVAEYIKKMELYKGR
jgi:nicotinate-nucleotide adenylyltransferase